MAKVLTSYDLQKGELAKKKVQSGQYQPIQMLPLDKKDDIWKEENMDWFEQLGLKHIKYNAKKYIKNYQLGKGIIDKNDYIDTEVNPYGELISHVIDENTNSALTLQFYPIIPNVINLIKGEFSQRDTKCIITGVDNYTKNEKLDALYFDVENYLLEQARQAILSQVQEQGLDLEDPEVAQGVQQSLENIKGLPEISEFYRKEFKSIPEQWAAHQINQDDERFDMYELENDAMNDYLHTKRQFWHINLKEDDYDVELWNPINSFCHVSPDVKYISQGNYVGRIIMMSVPDIINRYRNSLAGEDLTKLETLHKSSIALHTYGEQFTNYYDTTKPMSMQYPNSVHYEKVMAFQETFNEDLLADSNLYETLMFGTSNDPVNLIRVTEVYWKSFKKIGWLTRIDETGKITEKTPVSEAYEVTEDPIYDTSLTNNKTAENLIYGEHIEWVWVPEVWKGVKIGGNFTYNETSSLDSPIYINIEPIKFQFKGDSNLYDVRLPVEGPNFLGRLSENVPFVSSMAPYQILHNLAVNQAKDISIDELGQIILLDQNTIPKHSLGEEWGQNNFAKVYQTMKEYGILPIDTTLSNTNTPLNFNHFQNLDMSAVQRIKMKLDLADWAEMRCLASVGITRERMGTVMASQTATGTQQAIQNSYSQTEEIFTDHIVYIMPKVRTLMLNAAQFYQSKNPSIRLAYMTSKDENAFFTLNGTELLLKDFNIFASSRPDRKKLLNRLKQLVFENNTTNASIFDLNRILESDTTAEIMTTLKKSADELQQQQEMQAQREQEIVQAQIAAENERQEKELAYRKDKDDKDRQAKLIGDQIKALGYAKDSDIDDNMVPDVLEAAKFNEDIKRYENETLFKQKELDLKQRDLESKTNLENKKLETQKYIADKKVEAEHVKLKNPVQGEKPKK